MSKAEDYITQNTKTLEEYGKEYFKWLTPDQARRAVEIARGEVIDKTLDFLKDKLYKGGYIGIIDLCDEYIKAMKDE